MALVGEGKIDFVLGQVTGARRRRRPAQQRRSSRATTARRSTSPATRMLPFFGLTMKLGPVANWGLKLEREPDPGRHRDVRDQRAGHLRHRRHQHLSGQAQADPVRLPRGRADVAEGAPLRLSGQEADVPVHDVVDEPAEEARRGVAAPAPFADLRLLNHSPPMSTGSVPCRVARSMTSVSKSAPRVRISKPRNTSAAVRRTFIKALTGGVAALAIVFTVMVGAGWLLANFLQARSDIRSVRGGPAGPAGVDRAARRRNGGPSGGRCEFVGPRDKTFLLRSAHARSNRCARPGHPGYVRQPGHHGFHSHEVR